jgi:hypothetical protein
MGSILVSPAFNPGITINESDKFRNATSTELESILADIKNALNTAQKAYDKASETWRKSVDARDNFQKNNLANTTLASPNILNDYERLYVKLYQPWYDSGSPEGNTQINQLIDEIVVKRKYKQSTWGESLVVPNRVGSPKKRAVYDKVYSISGEELYSSNIYRFQQNKLVIPYINLLVSLRNGYVNTISGLNDDVDKKKKDLDLAKKTLDDQQALYTKTALDLENAKNLPEMTRIANEAAEAAAKIAASTELEKAKIQAQSETEKQKTRTILIAAVAALGIGAFLMMRK